MKIIIFGATGRMGKEVILSASRHEVEVSGGVVSTSENVDVVCPAGKKIPVSTSWRSDYSSADVLIDFSTPSGTALAIESALVSKLPLLICTTGLGEEILKRIELASKTIPIILASNTSIGVNVMFKLVAQAASLLGKDFDAEIFEIHHKFKKDAPSGTAISLAEHLATAKGQKLTDVISTGRSGLDLSRGENELGVQAARGGDVAGEHTVFFLGNGERIELTHRATTRAIFADGAIKAAKWLSKNKNNPGLYSMFDVLS